MIHIELEEAQIARLCYGAKTVELVLSSAPSSQPGAAADSRPVAGFRSGIVLRLEAAACQFDPGCRPGECVGAVQAARLQRDGQTVRRLPVPADWSGAFALELEMKNGTGLRVQASRLRLDLQSDSRFTESMAC
jgi:hypothetical protein